PRRAAWRENDRAIGRRTPGRQGGSTRARRQGSGRTAGSSAARCCLRPSGSSAPRRFRQGTEGDLPPPEDRAVEAVTFIPKPRMEALADELSQRFDLGPGFDVELLLDRLGLDLLWEQIPEQEGGIVLGQLVPGTALVVLNETHRARLERDGGAQRRFTIGHE